MKIGSLFSEKFLSLLASNTLFQDAVRPFISPKVAYLKDVKPSGTQGGTFTSGAWQTRDLNTIEGDSEIVSLNSNQFNLQAGKYLIQVDAPAFDVSQHKCLLRNITNSTDDIIGKSAFNDSTGGGFAQTSSTLMGYINISTPTVYEIRHRSGATSDGASGFGLAATFAGVDEVYTQVKLTKLY